MSPTRALGTETVARKPRDDPPGGEGALLGAVWEFVRPSCGHAVPDPRDAQPLRVRDRQGVERSVDLDTQRAASGVDEIDLGENSKRDAA